jgi:hypothetical protein
LQFVQGSTRRMTLTTGNNLDIAGGNLVVDNEKGISNSGGWTRISNPNGYIDFGPANTTWAHIYTDRPNFYFNKSLYILGRRVFEDGYHPNADKWTTPRSHTVTLTGAVTGSATQSVDGTGNKTWTVVTDLAGGFGDLYTYNVNMGLSTSWADVSGIAGSALPTGTYAIQIKVYNSDAGGGNYDEHYSGTMAWYGGGTNDGDSNEIPLHNAGHAYNGHAIYARTLRRYSSSMVLQLAASGTISADSIEIKIRKLI